MENKVKGENLVYALKQFIIDDKFKTVGYSGISELDSLLDGFETGKIYTIVAPSGVGKTMLGIQIFHESIKRKCKVLYISTEMAHQSITARLVTRLTKVDENLILKKKIPVNRQEMVEKEIEKLANLLDETKPIIVHNINKLEQVNSLILEVCAKNEADLIILDHFHNLRTKGDFYQATVNAAHDIQEAVVKHNVAFINLAQMSKADVKSSDNETRMARGASDLLDISDVFIVLERPKIEKGAKHVNEMTISVTKNRWGATKSIQCHVDFPAKVIYPIEFRDYVYDAKL